ncbi:MAG TPA: peptidylprolyl isomerase [Candidatus Dormibacteraeota bacterium]|nr:peptidylprolyl isomerase [Candidatus Dormibacteraeota bacterium]
MRLTLRRGVLLLVIGGALSACTAPAASLPFSEPAAAVVDGHTISMKAYQARLEVSRHRDPFSGIPEAIPSPTPTQRLETFTIEQLVREEIVRQEAEKRGISVGNGTLDSRITTLNAQAGATSFNAALQRNGFTTDSFRSYQRALLIEVALLHAMAKDRAGSAARELNAGQTFASVAARWSDDSGTSARGGDAGWLRPADIPEAPLAAAVQSLATGSVTGIIATNRGYSIASVLERRGDLVHLAVILVLAPAVDLYSPQGTPAWFTKFIDDREAALRRAGKIELKVGARAG